MAEGWTRAAELKAEARRLWERGAIARAMIDEVLPPGSTTSGGTTGGDTAHGDMTSGGQDGEPSGASEPRFPRRLRLRRPTSRELATCFDEVRAWIREIDALVHCRVERRTLRHAELGTNTLPHAVWLDDATTAAAFAGRATELARCRRVAERLVAHDARLLNWLKRRPLRALDIETDLDRLFAVHTRMCALPRPGIHLRMLDVPGVDSKFIEARRELLGDWLDLTLAPGTIDTAHPGVRGFVRRYGYRDKPVRVRMRSLDPARPLVVAASRAGACPEMPDEVLALADLTLDAAAAARLAPTHPTVVVTENEINFLTLPEIDGTLAIFGAGYGFDELGRLDWLRERHILYWGDIDTHGFAILDELRAILPQVRSVLMDRETLLVHCALAGEEPRATRRTLTRLTPDEAHLYTELLDGTHGEWMRLEQERVGYEWAVARLRSAVTEAYHGPRLQPNT